MAGGAVVALVCCGIHQSTHSLPSVALILLLAWRHVNELLVVANIRSRLVRALIAP